MCEAKRFLSSQLLDFSKNTEHFFHSSWRRRRGGSHFEKKIRVVSNLEICKLRWQNTEYKSNPRVVRRRLWRDRSKWKFVKNKEETMLQKRKKRRIWYAGKSVMAFEFWVRYLRFYPGFDLGFYFWGDILNFHLLFFKPSNT